VIDIRKAKLKVIDVVSTDPELLRLLGATPGDLRIYPYYRGRALINDQKAPSFITYSFTARPEAVQAVDNNMVSFAVWARAEATAEAVAYRIMALLHQKTFATDPEVENQSDHIYVKQTSMADSFSEQPNYAGRRLEYRVSQSTV